MLVVVTQTADTAKKVNLDPDHPVSLKIWHYYNGTQQAIFDDLVDEFNATKGKMKGHLSKPVNIGKFEEMLYEVWSSHNREFSVLR